MYGPARSQRVVGSNPIWNSELFFQVVVISTFSISYNTLLKSTLIKNNVFDFGNIVEPRLTGLVGTAANSPDNRESG